MDWASADVVGVINYLLPGFLAAWVFYGLTAHPKADAFERVVQALIFTVLVRALVLLPRLIWWKWMHNEGEYWTEGRDLVWSIGFAVSLGLIFAACANWNLLHWLLNKLLITKRTSYPSEWYSALHNCPRYLVLHLQGGRRLKGWPEEWPDAPDKGHFLMQLPVWLTNKGEEISVDQTAKILIPASQVEMVEMLKLQGEVDATPETLREKQSALFALHEEKEKRNGIKDTTTTAATISDAPASADR